MFQHLIGHHRFLLDRMEQIRDEWNQNQHEHRGDDWFDYYQKFREEYDGAERAREMAFRAIEDLYRQKWGA